MDFDAPPAPKAVPASTTPSGAATSGAKTLFWGVLLMIVAVILIVAGSQTSDNGDDMHSAVQLGWVLGALASPLILIGCIAVGVRMGLTDRDRDR
jgi:choline-glycine betaine transporter